MYTSRVKEHAKAFFLFTCVTCLYVTLYDFLFKFY